MSTLKPYLIVLALFFSLLPIRAASQLYVGAGFGFGNFSGMADSRGSVYAYGCYSLNLSTNYYLIGQVQYTNWGNRSETIFESGGNVIETQEFRTRASYLDVALLPGVKFGKGWKAHLGPYLGFKLGVQTQVEITDYIGDNSGSYSVNQTGVFERLDAGLIAGLSYPVTERIRLGASYQQGIRNLSTLEILGLEYRRQILALELAFRLGK